jgi:hypothetical protein
MFDPPPVPKPPPAPPQFGQSNIGASADAYTRGQRGGIASTIMTTPQGVANSNPGTRKTLLGQ